MEERRRMEYVRQIFPAGMRELLSGSGWQSGLEEIRVRVGQPVEFWYDAGVRCLGVQDGAGVWVPEERIRRDISSRRAAGEPEGSRDALCRPGAKQGENRAVSSGGSGVVLCRPGAEPGEDRAVSSRDSGVVLCRMGVREIGEMMSYISSYSLYAYREELRQGFLVIEGGHRVGLAGGAVSEGGRLSGVAPVTFLNIRIAHEVRGCARRLVEAIRERELVCNTLIFSRPGAGKTTLLRDCIRLISGGTAGVPGLKVCVVDERSELAACHLGVPQNDLGPRTDVLDGCGKPEGMQMLLRTMSPQVIAADELGGEEDFMAVEQAVYAGCRVIGTVHAGSVEELREKPYLREWVERRLFWRYVQVERGEDGTREITFYGPQMERLC